MIQDPTTISELAQHLGNISDAFKNGGLFFLIGIISFLVFKAVMAIIAKQRKATQEVTVNVPGAGPQNGNGARKECPYHNAHEQRLSSVETAKTHIESDMEKARLENREDHGKIFAKLTGLEVSTARIETEVKSAAAAAISAASAAAHAASAASAASASAAASARRRFTQTDPAR